MSNTTGAENVRWDLSFIYSDVDDPKINEDVSRLIKMARDFNANHKGKLSQSLGKAITDYSEIEMLGHKLGGYLHLRQSTDVANSKIKAKLAEIERVLDREFGEHLTFFKIELVGLSDAELEKLYAEDSVVARHCPWIEQVRIFKSYILSEPVESALSKRSSFGPSAWGEFFEELESDLEFEYNGEKKNLTEMNHLLLKLKDPDERFRVMSAINEGFKGHFGKYSAQTLYMVTGSGSVECQERSYKHPMEARNKSNRVPDEVVEALHKAVRDVAGPLAKRYYRLKARHLGLNTLRWSDRNAPMPFFDTTVISWSEAVATVLEAYESFSPTLADIIRSHIKEKRIDAPAGKGRRGGAFNMSAVFPDGKPVSFTFLNYLGSSKDVMTLAHELGHGVHGMLAGQAQGPIMARTPTAYAETASVFGEMTTFNFMRKKMEEGDSKSLLALIMMKIEDSLNTGLRQISFSNFERRIHGMDAAYSKWEEPKKHSVEELNQIWLEVTKELYGQAGEVFTYDNMEHLWAYIHHFHDPFYVYGYAVGDLLTQSLYASRPVLGDRFEELYLDLLRAGGTKNVVELLKPFNLDPTDENFWAKGIRKGLGELTAEAEELSSKMGI